MYLGRKQLGTTLDMMLQCVNVSDVASLPDNPPQVKVWSGSAQVLAAEMPIIDRYVQTGLFRYQLFLGNAYATGYYTVTYSYRVSTYYGLATDSFEIVPAGHANGQAMNMYFYHRPQADFIVYGVETGSIITGRNPTVR